MKKIVLSLLCVLGSLYLFAQDTFSIVAVDEETGEIGAAGASCVDGIAAFGGIQLLNDIIPGRGGVNAQAWVCLNPHINLVNAIDQMEQGLSPSEIIDWLYANDACSSQSFNPEYRQYGIVDFDPDGNARVAAFTGANADDYKGHITGPNYAIQGNILLGEEVLTQMEDGFVNTEGSLAEKLMGAMQGANIPGADQRCLDRGTSSTSAFLRVYSPDDEPGSPSLELSILEMPFGEEPIDSLQSLFDEWFTTNSVLDWQGKGSVQVFPNPVTNELQVYFQSPRSIETLTIYDTVGKVVMELSPNTVAQTHLQLDVSKLERGTYYLKFKSKESGIETIRIVKP
ncbi:MAG: DUF1028 domain-containing protein [Phaeodactylibacter sp.]|nr:DUF1028 domain-containing protein [Phaeodactylibacter sp.]